MVTEEFIYSPEVEAPRPPLAQPLQMPKPLPFPSMNPQVEVMCVNSEAESVAGENAVSVPK